jgi:ssDNA thymidine ADP-ribosyltransferase, DarT
MTIPPRPQLFHITHVDNIPSIVGAGGLYSDAKMIDRSANVAAIGMSSIKQNRLKLPVQCHRGDHVGECVPFYFCPRSIMLYLIHRANHPGLGYRGGQEPIVHLELDLHSVVTWADANERRWSFTLSNAGAAYAEFRSRLDQLGDLNWTAIRATDFTSPAVKEGKQAEFLVKDFVSWETVVRIGVHSHKIATRVATAISNAMHQPHVEVLPGWYY